MIRRQNQRSPASRSNIRARPRRLHCESLEPRLVLSAAPIPPASLGGLTAEAESAIDLAVQASIASSPRAGGAADISVTVINQGTDAAPAARVILQLPDALRLTSIDHPPGSDLTFGHRRVEVAVGQLAAAGQAEIVLRGTVDPAAGSAFYFSSFATSDAAEPNLENNFDTRLINVLPATDVLAAPHLVDLAPASDSGVSTIDNITSDPSLTFNVTGVEDGATVELLIDGTVTGSVVASGTTASVDVAGNAIADDGRYVVTAQQRVDGQTSFTANPVLVTIDRTTPEPLAPSLPDTIAPDQTIQVDFRHPGESEEVSYSIVEGPATATVQRSTGLFEWTPAVGDAGQHTVRIRVEDAAGNFTEVEESIVVTENVDAGIRLEAMTVDGLPVGMLRVGSAFDLHVYAQDRRPGTPLGVFSAYVDLAFDPLRLKPLDPLPLQYGPDFDNLRSGGLAEPGLIDELGAFQSQLEPTNLGEQLLATVRFEVLAAGATAITSRFASDVGHGLALYGERTETPPTATTYTTASIVAVDRLLARRDVRLINEDVVAWLNVMTNDLPIAAPDRRIVSVSSPNIGSASVSPDGRAIEFRTPTDGSGLAVFSYTITDDAGAESSATVEVAILPVNDPPVAVEDRVYAAIDSSDNLFDVLANDDAGPDPGDHVSLVSVTQGTSGGTVAVSDDGTRVVYTPPPGFRGREFFDYTIRDAHGATVEGRVGVNVVEQPARLHNQLLPQDVDGNGVVQPIDALRVINDLNRFGITDLVIERFDLEPPPFLDVDGDDLISPVDALRVINFLNRNGLPAGEAERDKVTSEPLHLPSPVPHLHLPQLPSDDDDDRKVV